MGDDVAGQCGQHGEQYRAPAGQQSYAAESRRGAALIEECSSCYAGGDLKICLVQNFKLPRWCAVFRILRTMPPLQMGCNRDRGR